MSDDNKRCGKLCAQTNLTVYMLNGGFGNKKYT